MPLGFIVVQILKPVPAAITAQAVARIAALEKEVATMLHTHSDLGAAMGELQIRLQDASAKLAASVARQTELECSLSACKGELESMRAAAAAGGEQQSGLQERAAQLQQEVIAHSPRNDGCGRKPHPCVFGGVRRTSAGEVARRWARSCRAPSGSRWGFLSGCRPSKGRKCCWRRRRRISAIGTRR
jgi:hypothetical protein